MTVYFVGAGPGDPELLTVKALRLLQRCQYCVYAGSLVSPSVLGELPAEAERFDSAALSLEEIVTHLRQAHERGLEVVRLHTGDPTIYGAIAEQMDALDSLAIPYEVVPGVSSFQAAAAALRMELTIPEVAQTVILSRIHGRTPVPESQSLQQLGATGATLCLFLSVHRIAAVTEELSRSYGADCPAAVVYRASWPDQRVIRGSLATLASEVEAAGIGRTAIIVVGQALLRGASPSKLYDASFSHGYRRAKV